jgi:hypothetical protein
MKALLFYAVFMGMAITMLRCSSLQSTASGGTGSETIIGKIVNEDGSAAGATVVTILPYNYNPVSDPPVSASCSDTTDDTGTYAVKVNAPFAPQYHLLAVKLDTRTKALKTTITISLQSDTTAVATDTLHNTGSVKIILSDTSTVANSYVYVQGTTFRTKVEQGIVVIDSVPAGLLPALKYINTSDAAKSHTIRTSVTVVSGTLTEIADLAAWRFSKRLLFNTTASGADVAGSVTNFPALIRLTQSNFNFAEAKANGGDLRFTKADGAPLSYEVERWDSAGGQAEIWVKVDTVYGNDSTHCMTMCWGNPGAGSKSNSATVFDTTKGFQGVWHLNEPNGLAAKDATGNHYDGTPSDTAPIAVSGAVGLAQKFNGVSSYLQMNGTAGGKLNFPENGHYTVSAWVYVDTLVDSMTRMIVGKGHRQYYLKLFSSGLQEQWEFTEFIDNIGFQITHYTPAIARSWKYLVGVRDGSNQSLYLDGVLVNFSNSVPIGTAPGLRDTTDDVSIGRSMRYVTDWNEGYAFFTGAIDEVRISNVARSADWVRLSYMNQKANGDALLIFR